MYVQYGFLYLILSRPKLKVQAEPIHSLRGDSITDGWLNPDSVKKIFGSDQWAAALLQTSRHSVSCMGR
jgi:hypothetical protein